MMQYTVARLTGIVSFILDTLHALIFSKILIATNHFIFNKKNTLHLEALQDG